MSPAVDWPRPEENVGEEARQPQPARRHAGRPGRCRARTRFRRDADRNRPRIRVRIPVRDEGEGRPPAAQDLERGLEAPPPFRQQTGELPARRRALPARAPSSLRPRASRRRIASASSPMPAANPNRRPLTRPSEILRVRPATSRSAARTASAGRPSARGSTLAPPPGMKPTGVSESIPFRPRCSRRRRRRRTPPRRRGPRGRARSRDRDARCAGSRRRRARAPLARCAPR